MLHDRNELKKNTTCIIIVDNEIPELLNPNRVKEIIRCCPGHDG